MQVWETAHGWHVNLMPDSFTEKAIFSESKGSLVSAFFGGVEKSIVEKGLENNRGKNSHASSSDERDCLLLLNEQIGRLWKLQLREDASVDFIRLHLRFGDDPRLERIGQHDV